MHLIVTDLSARDLFQFGDCFELLAAFERSEVLEL